MGGLFSAPSPPPIPIEEPDTTATEEAVHRAELLKRKRRGRRGTTATSSRGLLDVADISSQQKSLLGE